jgi:hypothetical protein
MIPNKVFYNMDNSKLKNNDVEYGFTFWIHLQFKKITIVIV